MSPSQARPTGTNNNKLRFHSLMILTHHYKYWSGGVGFNPSLPSREYGYVPGVKKNITQNPKKKCVFHLKLPSGNGGGVELFTYLSD